jgi:predicted DNA-binding transcriptional regulator YafY
MRVIEVYRILAETKEGTLVSELATQFRVTERQMRRDLNAIEGAECIISRDIGGDGRAMVWLDEARPRKRQAHAQPTCSSDA